MVANGLKENPARKGHPCFHRFTQFDKVFSNETKGEHREIEVDEKGINMTTSAPYSNDTVLLFSFFGLYIFLNQKLLHMLLTSKDED